MTYKSTIFQNFIALPLNNIQHLRGQILSPNHHHCFLQEEELIDRSKLVSSAQQIKKVVAQNR